MPTPDSPPDADVSGAGGGYPQRWETDVVLTDGGTVHLRPIRPDDADDVASFHLRQSADSVYMRYFTAMPKLTSRMLTNLTVVDYADRMAFVAELGDRIVGLGSFDRWPERATAEVAFMVDEDHRGRGLATVLLEYLVVAAREAGLTGLNALVLPSNVAMLKVFHRAGFETGRTFSDGLIEVTLAIEPDADAVALIEQRSGIAAGRSVGRLLAPASIAVVGAGREPGGLGHELFVSLRTNGFGGPTYPVNAHGGEVAGVPAWTSVVDIPDDIDLAVVAVPASMVRSVVLDCARKRVRGLLVVTAGFDRTGEMGPVGGAGAVASSASVDGSDAGDGPMTSDGPMSSDEPISMNELVHLARRWGMRLMGPESLGVINTAPEVSMVATFAPVQVHSGSVGLLTQSGTLGVAALDLAHQRGLGISTFVDVGAKADVSGNDVLQYWEHDDATSVVLMYLESFGNPRKFVRIARRMARTTALAAVKGGDQRPPGRAGEPAKSAWPEAATYGALLAQCGVIRVDNLRELFDVGRVLLHQPVPRGRRVAVVSNSRGATSLALDACVAAGLDVVGDGSGGVGGGGGGRGGGRGGDGRGAIDLAFDAGPDDYAAAMAKVADADVDATVIIYAPAMRDQRSEVAAAIGAASSGAVTTVATFLRAGTAEPLVSGEACIPLFDFPDDAVRVLGLLADHGAWRDQDPGVLPAGPTDATVEALRALVNGVLAGNPDGRWLTWGEVTHLAAAAGLALAPGELVADADAAAVAGERLGFPVVLKAVGMAPHFRAERGGVALGLRSADEVASAHRRMSNVVGESMNPALVQCMVGEGVDVLVAGHQHPNVGAVVQVGLGGIASVGDSGRPVGLVPLTDRDAHRLVASSGAEALLRASDADGGASRQVEQLVLELSGLLDAVPELADVVANPVIAGHHGLALTDLRIRVAPSTADALPDVRRL